LQALSSVVGAERSPKEPEKSLPAIAGGLLLWADDLQKLKKKIRDQEPVMCGYDAQPEQRPPRAKVDER
jgi:hypothetical protein